MGLQMVKYSLKRADTVKDTLQRILDEYPEMGADLCQQHIERLGEDYIEHFTFDEIARHIQALASLPSDIPVQLEVEHEGSSTSVTFLSYNYPGVFSVLSGILAGMDFSIVAGHVFTYSKRSPALKPVHTAHRRVHSPQKNMKNHRCIIDCFKGHLESSMPLPLWEKELTVRISAIFELLEKGRQADIEKARKQVNEWVVHALQHPSSATTNMLQPVDIHIAEMAENRYRLNITSQDTPAFLYALSSALALQDMSIERLSIRTAEGQIEDEMEVLNISGRSRTFEKQEIRLKMCVLLTKQFTYHLQKAPDPYAALSRFEILTEDLIKAPDHDKWMKAVADPHTMDDLARVLGTSDYLWEDFIRSQYEVLLPLLSLESHDQPFSRSSDILEADLQQQLDHAADIGEKQAVLNAFKDRELFLIDLDHIVGRRIDFRQLAEKLTALAEMIIRTTTSIIYTDLSSRHGDPMTIAGMKAQYALLGLGKMGGAALGYASDIELLFVYSDSGKTNGDDVLHNAEFFSNLVKGITQFIHTKREGIFSIDLRLRPHGQSGPRAVSMESFCKYYGPGGEAHSYELLSLVRLRHFGGDPALGTRLERLRDEFIYESNRIETQELRDLRSRQFREKQKPGIYNAKFSPGALVDVEYSVQLMQVMHAHLNASMRTPRIHLALEALTDTGVLEKGEQRDIERAYDFLRTLINALRMLRGNAKDLYLPGVSSQEFMHLARRMGYEARGKLDPARQLYVEFERRTATVRHFVTRHLGRESLPGPYRGNIADLLLADQPDPNLMESLLKDHGFMNPERAYHNLVRLTGSGRTRDLFINLAVLACDYVKQEPDPDMALNNWERFSSSRIRDAKEEYAMLFAQPERLHLMLSIFSRSQFLSETLIQHTEFFDWVTDPSVLYRQRNSAFFEKELHTLADSAGAYDDWLNVMRTFRKKEMLRIGTRDMCLGLPLVQIASELSMLADSIVQVALERVWAQFQSTHPELAEYALLEHYCILALGKLGGHELNYSSDIDLIAIYDDADLPEGVHAQTLFPKITERLSSDLSRYMKDGCAYRVDFRLRPYGTSGALAVSLPFIVQYYEKKAALWEIQAMLKMRPVAGCTDLGVELMNEVWPLFQLPRDRKAVCSNIVRMRKAAVDVHTNGIDSNRDIKNGPGGIRDVEFIVQSLQLTEAVSHPDIVSYHTMDALKRLNKHGLIDNDEAIALEREYIFLRKVEHYLQILEDQQIHQLPKNRQALKALSKRCLGVRATPDDLSQRLKESQHTISTLYHRYISEVAE